MTQESSAEEEPCTHDLSERETACADGFCLLCLRQILFRSERELAKVRFLAADIAKELGEVLEKLDRVRKMP